MEDIPEEVQQQNQVPPPESSEEKSIKISTTKSQMPLMILSPYNKNGILNEINIKGQLPTWLTDWYRIQLASNTLPGDPTYDTRSYFTLVDKTRTTRFHNMRVSDGPLGCVSTSDRASFAFKSRFHEVTKDIRNIEELNMFMDGISTFMINGDNSLAHAPNGSKTHMKIYSYINKTEWQGELLSSSYILLKLFALTNYRTNAYYHVHCAQFGNTLPDAINWRTTYECYDQDNQQWVNGHGWAKVNMTWLEKNITDLEQLLKVSGGQEKYLKVVYIPYNSAEVDPEDNETRNLLILLYGSLKNIIYRSRTAANFPTVPLPGGGYGYPNISAALTSLADLETADTKRTKFVFVDVLPNKGANAADLLRYDVILPATLLTASTSTIKNIILSHFDVDDVHEAYTNYAKLNWSITIPRETDSNQPKLNCDLVAAKKVVINSTQSPDYVDWDLSTTTFWYGQGGFVLLPSYNWTHHAIQMNVIKSRNIPWQSTHIRAYSAFYAFLMAIRSAAPLKYNGLPFYSPQNNTFKAKSKVQKYIPNSMVYNYAHPLATMSIPGGYATIPTQHMQALGYLEIQDKPPQQTYVMGNSPYIFYGYYWRERTLMYETSKGNVQLTLRDRTKTVQPGDTFPLIWNHVPDVGNAIYSLDGNPLNAKSEIYPTSYIYQTPQENHMSNLRGILEEDTEGMLWDDPEMDLEEDKASAFLSM